MNLPLVQAFYDASRLIDEERRRWNALTPDERRAEASDPATSAMESLAVTEQAAAQALVNDAADRHHIEQRAVVYLKLTRNGWAIDSPTFDGYPLEGYDDGALNEECEHADTEEMEAECEALRRASALIYNPTAQQLAVLLKA